MAGLVQRVQSAAAFDRERWALLADGLAVAIAASVPWSTSAALIFVAAWLATLLPTLDAGSLRRVLAAPAGGLPVVLVALALIGTLWAAEATTADRVEGLRPYFKLLVIPLLMTQFSRSARGWWVGLGFLISCCVLLATSWVLVLHWALSPDLRIFPVLLFGMPVRDYIAQSGEFTICIFLLANIALGHWRAQRHRRALACLFLMAAFLGNILYISVSRTMLVVIPALLAVFAWQNLTRRGLIAVLIAAVVAGGAAWSFSPPVRMNIQGVFSEVQDFHVGQPTSRAGLRIEFWRKSVEFIATAPWIGNGVGSQLVLFRGVDEHGVAGSPTVNPHNQILAIAIRLGLVGAAVLFALWISHLMLFRGGGLIAWTGLVVVLQNMVGSLFNSHLFDFAQGWLYVVGVGVAGGMMMRHEARDRPADQSA